MFILSQARRSGRGKVNLIILDVIRQNGCMRYMDTGRIFPEGLPRLFDLVTVEEASLRCVFYYTLRDCLVAEQRDQGLRVGRTMKVVTPRGEIFDVSTMTGGGDPSNIEVRMGSQVVARSTTSQSNGQTEIGALERELDALKADFQAVTLGFDQSVLQLSALQREMETLKGKIAAAERTLGYTAKTLATVPADLANAEQRLRTLQKTSAEEDQLTNEIARLTEALAKVTVRVDKLSGKIAAVDNSIWEVRAEKVQESERKLKKWQTRLNDVKKELGALAGAVTGDDDALNSHEATVKRKEVSAV